VIINYNRSNIYSTGHYWSWPRSITTKKMTYQMCDVPEAAVAEAAGVAAAAASSATAEVAFRRAC
jgi:hypothetical protein